MSPGTSEKVGVMTQPLTATTKFHYRQVPRDDHRNGQLFTGLKHKRHCYCAAKGFTATHPRQFVVRKLARSCKRRPNGLIAISCPKRGYVTHLGSGSIDCSDRKLSIPLGNHITSPLAIKYDSPHRCFLALVLNAVGNGTIYIRHVV